MSKSPNDITTTPNAPADKPESNDSVLTGRSRVKLLITRFIVSLIVVLAVSWLLDKFFDALSESLHVFQTSFYEAVTTLDPLNLSRVFVDAFSHKLPPLPKFSIPMPEPSVSGLFTIVGELLAFLVVLPRSIIESLIITNYVVWSDSNGLVHWLMVPTFGFFTLVWLLYFSSIKLNRWSDYVAIVLSGIAIPFGVSFFFLFVQLGMQGSYLLFNGVTQNSKICAVFACIPAAAWSWVSWGTGKYTEHAVSETALHFVKGCLRRLIHM
jgi:hypothetical protein